MRKLLQINECLNLSTGNIARAIGDVALEHGWESYIAFSSREPVIACKSKVIKVGGLLGPYLHYIENRIFDREGLGSKRATKRLIEQIKDIQPDIVQLHNIHDHWLNYKLLFEFLNNTGIKVVWTFHDCWAFTGHCFHFITKNCEKWKTGCYECPLQYEYPNTILDRSKKNYLLKKELFSNCKNLTIVPCSNWIRNFVKESFLCDKQLYVIKNGVNLEIFKSSVIDDKANDSKYRILAVSNVWNKEKGIQDIYKLRKFLSEDYLITIVGLTSEQVKSLPKGIIGIQRTQNIQELVELYSKSDVLINPTYADTFPTINLEALACGTPVITYRTGGSPETIDELTGAIVEQGDLNALCDKIKEFKFLNFKQAHFEDCRKRAEEKFDKNQCFEKYLDLYQKILSDNLKNPY